MPSRTLKSDASRLRSGSESGVLFPSSDSRLNNENDAFRIDASGRKRKEDVYPMEDLLKPSIIVKVVNVYHGLLGPFQLTAVQSHPPKLSVKPRSLQPLMLLPRERLPFSCLDLATPNGSFEYSRFYESTVKILDLESRMGLRPVILIARLETDKTTYVLERQDDGLYTLCKLGTWVDLGSLGKHATVAKSRLTKPRSKAPEDVDSQPLITPQLHKENTKRRLAIEAIQSLIKKPSRSRSLSVSSPSVQVAQPSSPGEKDSPPQASSPSELQGAHFTSANDTQTANPTAVTPAPVEHITQPTADDIFDNIRNQYFEALYHSLGSLAYFAKGPLSRARAAFHLDCDSNLDMNDLIEFLKRLVLTTVQIDKKYKETIPDIIEKWKTHIPDSDDEQGPKPKKRKTKKMKLGKDGLYPIEEEHIRKWWDAHKPQPKDDDSITTNIPQETRLHVSCLRTRETQLQMILILEILALEPLLSRDNANDSQLPCLPGDETQTNTPSENVPRKRNKHNLPVLLDVHADRLSIWQSTALDEMKMLNDSQSKGAQQSLRSTSDPLKDFCVDIIMPFFASRLPKQCDLLNRKLGGLVMSSQPKVKPKAKKVEPAKSKDIPGAVTKRRVPSKSSHTLESVLFKESAHNRRSMSRGPSGVIALMRSASTPTIPVLKREASEPVSVMSVPKQESKDSASFRSKLSASFTETASGKRKAEDKSQKEAQINAELQDAISSLRKPNRDVVGKAMAEAAERRATTSLSQLRKSKKPTQHPRFQEGIIKATPVGHGRFRDALGQGAHSQPVTSLTYRSIETDYIPSSSSMIPSSAPRKRKADAAFPVEESSPALPTRKRPADEVQATPVRPSALRCNLSSALGDGLVLTSSPVARRYTYQPNLLPIPSSSLRYRDSGIGMPSSPPLGGIAETPVKKARLGGMGSLEGFVTVTPVKKPAVEHVATPENVAGKEKEPVRKASIYEKLGWDDEYEDDLA